MTGWLTRSWARREDAVGRFRPRVLLLWWTLVVALMASVLTLVIIKVDPTRLEVSPAQHEMIDKLESVLLHDSVTPQYERVVNQFDARGFVAGIGDFSTADGGTLDVVRTYAARVGPNELARDYLSTLEHLAVTRSGDTTTLVGFPDAWRRASSDAVFRAVQVDVLNSREYQPAFARAEELGLRSVLGLVIIYDSLLQHGAASVPDGLPTLIDATNTRMGGTAKTVPERDWLTAFLDERRSMLLGPADSAHRAIWPLTTGRLDVLAALIADGHDDLAPPIEVNPYGTAHLIDSRGDDGPGSIAGGQTAGGAGVVPPKTTPPTGPSATLSSTPNPPTPGGPTGRATPTGPAPTSARSSAGPPAALTPRSGLVVRLVSQTTGKAFGVDGGSSADGALIIQGGPAAAQQWRLGLSMAGCFSLTNVRTGKALDNPDGTDNWAIQLQQWTPVPGNQNQAWCFDPAGSGLYSIRSLAGGLVLDLQHGLFDDGTPIQQYPPSADNPNQEWRLVAV